MIQGLGIEMAEAYLGQRTVGPNYLSALLWDAWIGTPVNPNDPPYINQIMRQEVQPKPELANLTQAQQHELFCSSTDVMWTELSKEV